VAVVVVGTTDETETEGADRTTLALPGRQDELVRRVVAANPDTIVVVNAGSPVLMPWADDVAAILLTWFPGQEGGNALADVLLGVEEPGGRLPTTWPADEDVPSTTPVDGVLAYEADEEETRIRPLFRFGHGLGYTTWAIEKHGAAGVMVRNTGARAGREVVQVYVGGKLADFATVQAKPGQAVTVRLEVT
jgi:beta-glucosidase